MTLKDFEHLKEIEFTKDLANCIRIISADAVENAKSGHPGMPLGFADVMTVLAQKFLSFNPNDPSWFNRDRLILSAGHGSMLLYSFYHLSGYQDFTLEQIKNFRKLKSVCAGHPEYGLSKAIETTTGPLGQGVGNAVGFAIAQKKYQTKLAEIGKGHLCDYKIFCIAGDGCLMEGVSYESMSLAGHLNLDNLIILFDDNSISIDGPTSLSVSEDHLLKMQALGFFTISVNGHEPDEIERALDLAINANKPAFISFKTQIGYGANKKLGSNKSHGSPLGSDEINFLKNNIGFLKDSDNQPFYIGEELIDSWRQLWLRNKDYYENWKAEFELLDEEYKEFLQVKKLTIPSFDNRSNDSNNSASENYLSADKHELLQNEATRVSSGKIIAKIMQYNDKAICGSADLAESSNTINIFSKAISKDDFSGNFINFGVREHAMGAICNGLALSGFNPICSSFFVFTDYMRPAIRLAALMGLPVIYVMTHDSIGVGEDGPTHQPVEHLASFRAMPNINIYRPADGFETLLSYEQIVATENAPSMLVLSRQKLSNLHSLEDFSAFYRKSANISSGALSFKEDHKNYQGAYILSDGSSRQLDYTIFASGSEVKLALDVKDILESKGFSTRVVSVYCMDLLYKSDAHKNRLEESMDNQMSYDQIEYLKGEAKQIIAIEAACELGWHKIIYSATNDISSSHLDNIYSDNDNQKPKSLNGLFFGINEFGDSSKADDLFEYYGLTADKIAHKILRFKS